MDFYLRQAALYPLICFDRIDFADTLFDMRYVRIMWRYPWANSPVPLHGNGSVGATDTNRALTKY
jgi:hypothetical protein